MFIKIGHRGAMGYAPENTLLSFKKAIELNVDMIEMDVFRCKTGELIIIHDFTLDRTTNGSGYVWDLTYEEIRSFETEKGQKIPRLEEVLDVLNNIKINLELKGENTAEHVFEIITRYVKHGKWKYEDFFISSFNHYLLQEFLLFKKDTPGISICPLIQGIPIGLAEFAEKLDAYSINISNEFVNKDIVIDAHQRGMKIFTFVVNDSKELSRMRSLGVDGIFTDYPDIK